VSLSTVGANGTDAVGALTAQTVIGLVVRNPHREGKPCLHGGNAVQLPVTEGVPQ